MFGEITYSVRGGNGRSVPVAHDVGTSPDIETSLYKELISGLHNFSFESIICMMLLYF